jgi:hypothetical protein
VAFLQSRFKRLSVIGGEAANTSANVGEKDIIT